MHFTKIIASAALVAATPAFAGTTVNVANDSFTGIGATISTNYDQIELTGNSFVASGPGTYTIGSANFLVGFTGSNSGGTSNGFLTAHALVDGVSTAFDIAYSITVGNTVDSIILGGNAVQFGNYSGTLNTLQLSSSGSPVAGNLTADLAAAVPEPAAWALMIVGFGLVGGAMRSRRQSVSFA